MKRFQFDDEQFELAHDKRSEIMDVWKTSVTYLNNVCKVVNYFPKNVRLDLDRKAKSSALSISNNIAKGSKASSRLEFQTFLSEAKRSVGATVSALFIAKRWNYLRKDLYHEAFQNGSLLNKRIERVSGVTE